MVNYSEVRKIINSSGMAIKKYANGRQAVLDSTSHFKGMSIKKKELIKEIMAEDERAETLACAQKSGYTSLDSIANCKQRAEDSALRVVTMLKGDLRASAAKLKENAFDNPQAIRDSIFNESLNVGTGNDANSDMGAMPNVYISPWDAANMYSQKSIFETIPNKKSQSILLNGLRIENSHLSQKQIDTVKEHAEVLNFKHVLVEGILSSLIYGGNLTFPLFKRDNPATTGLPLSSLLKLGVLKKNCIDYFVQLDRWNTFIIPPYNPTSKDFMRPEVYTIPFLGSDVHHSRVARIVTAKQPGYLGVVANQGWGISDYCGYVQPAFNYKIAVKSIPLFIQQMSILVRTINVDGILATEGSNALEALLEQNTMKIRKISANNPVNMDVLGDLKSIDRNFTQVKELILLLRQDLGADGGIPEPLLYSSEKGNFSSGDETQGNLNKQWETVKLIHKSVEPQAKQLAKVIIIDALGTSQEVLKALPYTQIHFDEPIIANSLERSQIGKNFAETVFELVSAHVPMDEAVLMSSASVSEDFAPTAETLEKLKRIQATTDERDKERFEKEIEKEAAEIEKIKEGEAIASTGRKSTNSDKKDDNMKTKTTEQDKKGYSRLEQKGHEKTRLGDTKRSEKLGKKRSKGQD